MLSSIDRRGIAVVTVNMDAAAIEFYLISDNSLVYLLSGYQFLLQLDDYDMSSISDQVDSLSLRRTTGDCQRVA